jgi:transposase
MKKTPNTHTVPTQTSTARKAKRITLGVDVHADTFVVVRQFDHATPQPAQKFTPEGFLKFVDKQFTLAEEVYSCYEAGPFGYRLHRELLARKVVNYVIRPQKWDELSKGIKTDKTDALALVLRLSRYVDGNKNELAVIRVPTEQEEQERAITRHREQLSEERRRLEAQGRSLLLYYGSRVKGQWWAEKTWYRNSQLLPEKVRPILYNLMELILKVDKKLQEMTTQIEQEAKPRPIGFGAYTTEVLRREVLDWSRFNNRREVASYTGLCPGIHASGLSSRTGHITKHGNPTMRWILIELAWRVIRYQKGYPPVVRWQSVLSDRKASKSARKKAVVAIARHLAIDLWRLATGRTTAEALNLKMFR